MTQIEYPILDYKELLCRIVSDLGGELLMEKAALKEEQGMLHVMDFGDGYITLIADMRKRE